MRYREIIEGVSNGARTAQTVSKQNQRTADALRKMRSKQDGAADALTRAQKLPIGPERQERINAAQRRDADARHSYSDTLNSANDRARDAMAKRL